MSELLAPFDVTPDVVEQDVVEQDVVEQRADDDASPRTPVLITEKQVLFGTAAALPLQPAKSGRRWTGLLRAIGASVRAAFVTSSDEAGPMPHRYPPRNDYLEDSRMAREMLRL